MTFGNRLKKLREEKKINQIELSKILNIANSTLSLYENGGREPNYETLTRIADYFKVSTDYLLKGEEINSIPPMPELPFKATSRDKKQWEDLLKRGGEAFFYNDEIDIEDKKEMLDIFSDFFVDAKIRNREKFGKRKNKNENAKKETQTNDNQTNCQKID